MLTAVHCEEEYILCYYVGLSMHRVFEGKYGIGTGYFHRFNDPFFGSCYFDRLLTDLVY
jgi:hypothetical protein